jgi:lysophospholipase L1-like esterase
VPGSRAGLTDHTVPAGQSAWTPALVLPAMQGIDAAPKQGRTLAFSAWVEGASGPITWHAKSMATSYLSAPGDRDAAGRDDAFGFTQGTTSTFVVDALDAWLPRSASAFVAFGDSLTDGTGTTLNGHDRRTDVLQREAWRAGRDDLAIVNAGIGGNQVFGPPPGGPPWRGGPCAVDRVARDVLSLSGVRTVFWLQGINDFSDNGGAEAAFVAEAMSDTVRRMRGQGLRVIGATVPSALGASRPGHGGALQDARRRAFNDAVRAGTLFDEVVDLDRVMTDPLTGRLHARFDGDDTLGGPGDGIHPNRAGHAAMARCIGAACLGPMRPGRPRRA